MNELLMKILLQHALAFNTADSVGLSTYRIVQLLDAMARDLQQLKPEEKQSFVAFIGTHRKTLAQSLDRHGTEALDEMVKLLSQ